MVILRYSEGSNGHSFKRFRSFASSERVDEATMQTPVILSGLTKDLSPSGGTQILREYAQDDRASCLEPKGFVDTL